MGHYIHLVSLTFSNLGLQYNRNLNLMFHVLLLAQYDQHFQHNVCILGKETKKYIEKFQ